MSVVTRFAPSPTGYLHIGGARTALFNYLYARKHNGKFLLRIEDTDKERSTLKTTEAIFSGLSWLGLNYDNKVVFQSERINEHKKAALRLITEQKAYYCFCSQEEIDKKRDAAIANKEHFIFHSPWRDADPSSYPTNIKPVVRLKAPRSGNIIIYDQLQGDVVVPCDHLDDMVLLRSDGSPTYMLAVVIDDHDMGITHIIRGDDHLTNAARQIILYQALGYKVPIMVHIPLIHGADGAKLSKRHGALGIDVYKDMGFLPEAICNYLLRLGWSHGDDEIISREQAIKWFDVDGLGKSPAKLDIVKMKNINASYLRNMNNEELTKITIGLLEQECRVSNSSSRGYVSSRGDPKITIHHDALFLDCRVGAEAPPHNDRWYNNILKAMESIKLRSELTTELKDLAKLYLPRIRITYSSELQDVIKNCDQNLISSCIKLIQQLDNFNKDNVQAEFKKLAGLLGIKIGELIKPIRILLTGLVNSPSIFEMIAIIGKEEVLRRLQGADVK